MNLQQGITYGDHGNSKMSAQVEATEGLQDVTETDLPITNALVPPEMAPTPTNHGEKRRPTLSPSTYNDLKRDNLRDPEYHIVTSKTESHKRRIVLCEETEREMSTGNDPKIGQPQEQYSSKSNMAAPFESSEVNQNKPLYNEKDSLLIDVEQQESISALVDTSISLTDAATALSVANNAETITIGQKQTGQGCSARSGRHFDGCYVQFGRSAVSAPSLANNAETITIGQTQTCQGCSARSGRHFDACYVQIGHDLLIPTDTTTKDMQTPSDPPVRFNGATPFDPPDVVSGSMTPSDPPVRVDGSMTPSDPPVRVDGSVPPSGPPVRVDGSVTPSGPPVRVDGSMTPSGPPVRVDGSVTPSDPTVRVDGSMTPSGPPVRVDGSVTPSGPPVRVDGSVTPSGPPVRVDGSVTPSDPTVRVDGSMTPSGPPVKVDGSVTPSGPPVRVDGSVTPSGPPVRVDGSVIPSDPPVRVDGSVTPSDPPVRVDGTVTPSDPTVRVDGSVTPSDPAVRDDSNMTPSDEMLVPHNTAQEKVQNVNPPSPYNKTPSITKPNLRSRQPRPHRYREVATPPSNRKTSHSTRRAKVLKKKVLKTPSEKCNDCSVRNAGVPTTKTPIVANEKPTKEAQKKRGRPKKQTKNEEHDHTDIHQLLREINDAQSRQICTLIDNKITDLKSSIGIEIQNVKENVKTNTTAISNLQSSQKSVDSKIGNLEKDIEKHSNILSNFEHSQSTLVSRIETLDGNLVSLNEKTCDLDSKLDSTKQDHESEQANRALSQQIVDVEYGLAAHIETIKGNMEEELSGAKQNQIYLENRLMDLTTEIHHQNIEMNAKIQNLKNDFEQLKALSETASDTFRTTSASSFFSNRSSPSVSTDTSQKLYQTFQNSNPQVQPFQIMVHQIALFTCMGTPHVL